MAEDLHVGRKPGLMKKNPTFVFLVRLVNVPGIIIVFLVYCLGMYNRKRQAKETTLYGSNLRAVLICSIPWVSTFSWISISLPFIVKQLL